MEPTSALFTQDESKQYLNGEIYNYDDTPYDSLMSTTKEDKDCLLPTSSITYFGSKTHLGSQFIVPGTLLFARKRRKDEFSFIGQVVYATMVQKHIQPKTPAKYQLIINHNATFNNITYKTVLDRMDRFHGSGCLKKAALYRMGYVLDSERKGSNIQAGLNAIKPIKFIITRE